MPARQRDELELVTHRAEFLTEVAHRVVVEIRFPVERRGTVVGEQLLRELGVNRVGETTRLLEIRFRRFAPDHVRVRRIGQATCNRLIEPGLCNRILPWFARR